MTTQLLTTASKLKNRIYDEREFLESLKSDGKNIIITTDSQFYEEVKKLLLEKQSAYVAQLEAEFEKL